jgi:Concanavalin A-like lectin/glucanases superfamily
MTTVTSLTADRMLAIEAASVVDGDVIGGNLILTKHDGSQINAGPVTGPTGPQGPQGALLPVISGVPVLDVGVINQIRAGRQLTAADFTNMGLSAPAGLWNLSDLSDVSGNGRNLLNKGAVPFDVGINGTAATAAKFSGSTAQALYIPDTGAADPFRIKTGSFGCWLRSAKINTRQDTLIKSNAATNFSYGISVGGNNMALLFMSISGPDTQPPNGLTLYGVSNVVDDRWHFVIGTYDGTTARIYIDGILENAAALNGALFSSPAPLNIGAIGADGSTAAAAQHYGRIDEAFITNDVLSEDQIRNLYCVKIPHTLADVPSRVSLNVHRRRKGATLVAADFPTQPLRLYNFSGGSLGDEGSNGVAVISGGCLSVSGPDGSNGNAFNFNGTTQTLAATDTGLPSVLATRSYGAWFKTSTVNVNAWIIGIGATPGTNDMGLWINTANNIISLTPGDNITGSFICDGQWHHVVVTEDNAAIDGVKRKMYVDGRLTGISTVLGSVVLGGTNHFRIGSRCDGSGVFNGQIDGVFVCDYALTAERIAQLYAKGSQTLASSPKNPGDHVEAMSTTSLLATFDTLESQHTIDLGVEP